MSNFGPRLNTNKQQLVAWMAYPVSAYLASGNPMDMTGWASRDQCNLLWLNGIANGDGTNYTICTGEVSTDKGETLLEDGSDRFHGATMLCSLQPGLTRLNFANTTGGFITGTG